MAGFLLLVAVAGSLYPLAQTLIARAAPYVYEQTDQIGNPVDMDEPIEFAVDSAGNYYTASINYDYYIRKFSPAGVELMRFGGTEWSSAVGLLGWPSGIAVKSNGEIYVSDGDNMRINVYSTTGQFVREITTFGAGLTFSYNEEIHFASNGNLYVLDDGGTIRIFDSNDNYLSSYTNPGIGIGQFSDARDFAVDTNGDVYVGDYATDRILVYDASWNYLRTFSTGALDGPRTIALTQDSHLMVYDLAYTIKKYTTAGVHVVNIGILDNPAVGGYGVANGEIQNTDDIVVLPNGNVSTLESYPSRIQTFAPDGTYLSQFGNAGSEPGQFGSGIIDVTVDASGNVYVPDIDNERIQKFDADGNFILEFGNQATFIGTPRSIAISPINGNIYVFDGVSGVCNSRILIFDPAGAQLGTVASCGTGVGQFANLGVGLAINAAGEVFINDTLGNNGKIIVYSSAGTFLREWYTTPVSSTIRYQGFMGMDASSNVYLVTSGSSYIIKYNSTGTLLATYGKRAAGTPDGHLRGAQDIEIAPNGMMYVAEASNSTISVFDSNGNFMRRFGSPGYGQDQFFYPQALAMGPNGKLYIADDMNNRISIYSTTSGPDAASVPRNLAASYAGPGSLSVSWSAPASDGGDPVDGYLVEYQVQGAHNEWETHSQTPANQLSQTMDGLPAGDYNVRVKAVNRGGHSPAATTAPAIRVHAALQLQSVITPLAPVQDSLSGTGVYADGSTTLMSRFFSNRVHADVNGNETARFGNVGLGDGQARGLRNADVDASDKLYVADDQNRRITKYNKDGTLVAHYTTGVRYPYDIAIDETSSYYYILTSTSTGGTIGRVEKYTIAGVFVAVVAPAVTSATAMTVGPDGSLYIAHRTGLLRQVAKYAADGTTLLATFGQNGSGTDGLLNPSGVGVLSTGEVVVSDDSMDVVKVFASDGSVLGKIGTATGAFFHQFNNPGRIQVKNDLIYVAQTNPQVKVLSLYEMPAFTAPTVPQNITVDTSTPQTLEVAWTAPTSDGGDPVVEYVVEYKEATGSTWTTEVIPPDTLLYTISDLSAGTYDVRIIARNDYGDSPVAQSIGNVVSGPAAAAPIIGLPPAIAGLLPSTGTNTVTLLIAGVLLLAAGAGLVAFRGRAKKR